MKIRTALIASTITALLTGCSNLNTGALVTSGVKAFQAATLNDNDIRSITTQACENMDSNNRIAPADSSYAKRLDKIAQALGDDINGQKLSYKVYMDRNVNAWAMANGCIRVYSGLMDMMTDNEVEGVIGHEMGHVALGHTRKAIQVAYAASAARSAAGAAGGVAAQLSQSQLADLGEKLINSQFSQSQESSADDYSYTLLKQRGIDPKGLVTSFEKLAQLDKDRSSSMFDSHPPSKERADNIRKKIAADSQK